MGFFEDLFGTGEVGGNKGSDGKGGGAHSHSNFEAPVHATRADTGKDVTVAFGLPGTLAEGRNLVADGHKSAAEFYGTPGNKGHDDFGPNSQPGDKGDRGQSSS